MELVTVDVSPSPDRPGRVRIAGRVAYDDRPGELETFWFDVGEQYAAAITASGDPWLACLLPLAVTLGEPLRLPRAVDDVLLQGAHELMDIWRMWFPPLAPVPIVVDERAAASMRAVEGEREGGDEVPGGRVGAFFSGGLDSFFTVLRHEELARERPAARIDDLVTVWGFDIPLSNAEAFAAHHRVLGGVADALDKPLIDVATNIRTTRWASIDWGHIAHGCALAAVALLLERRWHRVLIASSNDYLHLRPWGSHPITDPLFSTRQMSLVHDGAAVSRFEKALEIARSPFALSSLHVCWRGRSHENCGACAKCYRMMLSLEIVGKLAACPVFPAGSFDVRRVARLHAMSEPVIAAQMEMQRAAVAAGRADIARALGRSNVRSRRLNRWRPRLAALAARRVVWRLASPLERMLFPGAMR